jgi:phosphate starvation-inducible membrane PsiE
MSEPQATRVIARVLGPLLLLTAPVFLFEQARLFALIPTLIGDDALALFIGYLSLGTGLVMLAFHTKFHSPTQILITLLGAATVLRGALLIFWPHAVQKIAQIISDAPMIFTVAAFVVGALGLWLSFVGWISKA